MRKIISFLILSFFCSEAFATKEYAMRFPSATPVEVYNATNPPPGGSGLTIGTTAIASGTSGRLLYDNAAVLGELDTATYPSLTEISYVKGVTSGIQVQIDAKGVGTVTSVATDSTLTGGTITTTGTLGINPSGTPQVARLGLGAAADSANFLEITQGTLSAASQAIDITGTWTNAINYVGIQGNWTDTSSSPSSRVIDLKVSGISQFKVTKTGALTILGGITAGNSIIVNPTSGGNTDGYVDTYKDQKQYSSGLRIGTASIAKWQLIMDGDVNSLHSTSNAFLDLETSNGSAYEVEWQDANGVGNEIVSGNITASKNITAQQGLIADQTSLGSEKLTNGTFTGNANNWTLNTGYAYSSNTVLHNSNGTGTLLQTSANMASALVAGDVYLLTYTITSWTVGNVTPACGGATLTTSTDNGTFTEVFRATSTADLTFTPSNTARFTIDNVSLKKITAGNLAVCGNILMSGATSGAVTIAQPATSSGTNTLQAVTDTFVYLGTTDTLTNKTLTSPILTTPALGTPSSGILTNCTGLPAGSVVAGTFGSGAFTFPNAVIHTNNAITASGNAATVPITARLNTVTNNSAATLTITMTTTSATDGQMTLVRILDASAAAQTITWVNTENSTATAPTTSNGSTTLPLTVGFMYNSATSKWRCIASA